MTNRPVLGSVSKPSSEGWRDQPHRASGRFLTATSPKPWASTPRLMLLNHRPALLLLCLVVTFGCGSNGRPDGKLPQLHPARGKVTRAGQTVAGGMLKFRADSTKEDSRLMITSVVHDDGTFELATTHALSQKKKKGAPAGDYTVTYLPPGETQDVMPVTLPDKVTIASGSNDLTIKLDGK